AVRQLLEAPPMRDVARNFPQEEIERFRRLADGIGEGIAARDLGAYLAADEAFHLALLGLVGNGTLTRLVADLRSRTRLTGLSAMLSSDSLGESVREHHELLDLIVAGDGEGAYELMVRHIGHVTGWWSGRDEHDEDTGERIGEPLATPV